MREIVFDLFAIAIGIVLIWHSQTQLHRIRGISWSLARDWERTYNLMTVVGIVSIVFGALFLIVDSLQLLLWIIIAIAVTILFWQFVLNPKHRH